MQSMCALNMLLFLFDWLYVFDFSGKRRDSRLYSLSYNLWPWPGTRCRTSPTPAMRSRRPCRQFWRSRIRCASVHSSRKARLVCSL